MNKFAIAIVAGLAAGAASADSIVASNTTRLEWGIVGTSLITEGPVNLFPSAINIAGASGAILDVNVILPGGFHTFFSDLEIILVAPNGDGVVLLDFDGFANGDDLNGDLGFDDQAASQAPATGGGGAPAGTWQVSNFGTSIDSGVVFNDVGDLSGFNGLDANGDWELYIWDQGSGDTGRFASGWNIEIETVPTPASAALLGLGGLAAARRRR